MTSKFNITEWPKHGRVSGRARRLIDCRFHNWLKRQLLGYLAGGHQAYVMFILGVAGIVFYEYLVGVFQ